jgi:L-asparaginase / beta-aspartyl-peptidase
MLEFCDMAKRAIAIQGGAGTILRSRMTPALEAEYRHGLENALRDGWAVLSRGGRALDAVEAAVRTLEDFPLFNAGRGSVFTHEGKQEMDASIMDGKTLRAGAVAFVKGIKNPISLARQVMERTEHVLLAGDGANYFAEQLGVPTERDEYFFTEHRWLQLQEAITDGQVRLDHSSRVKPIGTVGAVACDASGNLAAATSTGGMTNKKYGRVGDTPLVGLGNYADGTCAVSCTGHGEYFMQGVAAYDVSARMRYKGIGIRQASFETIGRLTELGGEGGLIAVDRDGNISLPFNSEGMYRAYATSDGESEILIYS